MVQGLDVRLHQRFGAGVTDERTAGNGSLMRVAPVGLFCLDSAQDASRIARDQSRTTHGAPQSVEACDLFVALLRGGILGAGRGVLEPRAWNGHVAIREVASG